MIFSCFLSVAVIFGYKKCGHTCYFVCKYARRASDCYINFSIVYVRVYVLIRSEVYWYLLHPVSSSNKFECLRCRVTCYSNYVHISLFQVYVYVF